ncbi:MAG: AraC family transcriptional regulator [Bacteroidales bacterium]|nr:AraC family transcriptional regulator [Bacteroidales bacterium]
MENQNTYNLNVEKLQNVFPDTQWVGIGKDFCMLNVSYDDNIHVMEHPCRFDGLLMLYCISGHVKLSVNLNEYEVSGNHLVITTPGKILKVAEVSEEQDLRYIILAMSREFASELRIDMKPLINDGIALMETPVIGLEEDDVELMSQYLSLMAQVIMMKGDYQNDALRSLVSSMLCIIAGVWREKMEEARKTSPQSTSRSRMIFEQFIKLVSEYHTKHRNVGFYADKLCLTPKYLSKLIKTASGKSAPEWIDAYVILEAKNLLKYSDITIKEIVYRLNFPNQSVFYKFFKARTGMTPSEYRAS